MLTCRSLCYQVYRIWGQWISVFWILQVLVLTVPKSYPICFLRYFNLWFLCAWLEAAEYRLLGAHGKCCWNREMMSAPAGQSVTGCGWIHWLAIQKKTRWCCTSWSQMVTEIIKISHAANAWKITLLQSTQSRDGIPTQTEGCVRSICKDCMGWFATG